MVKESREESREESIEDPFKDLKEEITERVKNEIPSRSPMRTRVIKKILKNRIEGHIFLLKQLRGISKGVLKKFMSPDGETLERKTQGGKRTKKATNAKIRNKSLKKMINP
jgi:hypothetical protein